MTRWAGLYDGDPEALRLGRPMPREIRHLWFGAGPHFCLGAPIARRAAGALARRCSAAYPGLRIVVAAARERRAVPGLRAAGRPGRRVTGARRTSLERLAAPAGSAATRRRSSTRRGRVGAHARRARPAGAAARVPSRAPASRPAIGFGVRQDAAGIAWLLGALRAGLTVVVLDPGLAPEHLVAAVPGGRRAGRGARWRRRRDRRHPILRASPRAAASACPDCAIWRRRIWATSRALVAVAAAGSAGGWRRAAPDRRGRAGAGALHLGHDRRAARRRPLAGEPRRDDDDGRRARPARAGRSRARRRAAPRRLRRCSGARPSSCRPARRRRSARGRTTPAADVTPRLAAAPSGARVGGCGRRRAGARGVVLGWAPVRNAGLGGAARGPAGRPIASIYGMTEHMLVAASTRRSGSAHDEREGDLVGAAPRRSVRIADDGEVWVAGPALARGYLGEPQPDDGAADGRPRPSMRRAARPARPPQGDAHPRRREHLPGAVRSADRGGGGLEAAFLVGVERPDGDERVVLFGVPRPGDDPEAARRRLESVAERRERRSTTTPGPMLVVAIATLPRSGRSGKPDRGALAQLSAARALGWGGLRRIAVTGATGFVGGAIAGRLVAGGHDVLAIGRRPHAPATARADALGSRRHGAGAADARAGRRRRPCRRPRGPWGPTRHFARSRWTGRGGSSRRSRRGAGSS